MCLPACSRLQQEAFLRAFQARIGGQLTLDDNVPEDYMQAPADAAHELKGWLPPICAAAARPLPPQFPYPRTDVGVFVVLADLYELQRQRMEEEIRLLRKERDTWLEVGVALPHAPDRLRGEGGSQDAEPSCGLA
jgi:hypothetical protein